MVYTLALANSYGRFISELKRQIETVSQAESLGRGPGEYGKEHGERSVSPPPLFYRRRRRIKSSWHSVL